MAPDAEIVFWALMMLPDIVPFTVNELPSKTVPEIDAAPPIISNLPEKVPLVRIVPDADRVLWNDASDLNRVEPENNLLIDSGV